MTYDFKKLKAERESRLMTMSELSAEAGVSLETLRQLESGKAPWKKAIRKVLAALERTKDRKQDVVLSYRRRERRSA